MKDVYDPSAVEKKWQDEWKKRKTFAADNPSTSTQESFYVLEMFPYPSGNLHMGHVRNYSIGDVVARYQKMHGKNVLHPIGWDAFGLPAENAAIKNQVHPEIWTRQNIATMRLQLQALGFAYDWDREFATCDAEYYRWNQWFFLKFYEKGWVYKKKATVNWCPSCRTVLANEQVSSTGHCWRCDSLVQLKELEQWFIKITAFAEALLQGHEQLRGHWPQEVLTMQAHWIGRSDGADVTFTLENSFDQIKVFTTRPDTLFGATFLAIAPDHPLAKKISAGADLESKRAALSAAQAVHKRDRTETADKNGFPLNVCAINPVNQQKIPVWVADYVLMEYGTGAIMAVPAHDQRDFDFAMKYEIPMIQVITPHPNPLPARGEGEINSSLPLAAREQEEINSSLSLPAWKPEEINLPRPLGGEVARRAGEGSVLTSAYEGEGVLVNSGEFNGLSSKDSKRKVAEWLSAKGQGKATVTYKLRDWLISRQRYWGTPIPMVRCPQDGIVPVPEKDLPVTLPTDVAFTGVGESPLALSPSFVNVACPKCGGPARRETDTMDTFVDSSWYYARYGDPHNTRAPFESATVNRWLPADQYVGGIEHACMHLIYARFWHKAMKELGLVTSDEPFARLLTQGMVTLGGTAMSKSKGNVVDPNSIIEKYGADTARLFILFAVAPEKQLEWNDDAVAGQWRFLNRVWRLVQKSVEQKSHNVHPSSSSAVAGGRSIGSNDASEESRRALLRKIHGTIQKVTIDLGDKIQINTAIAAVMELVNLLYLYDAVGDATAREAVRVVVQLLAPMAPHLMEELWQLLGEKGLVCESSWPVADPQWLIAEIIEVPVQMNGKLRSLLRLAPGLSQDVLQREALADPKVQAALQGKSVVKVIVIPDKLVNVVAK